MLVKERSPTVELWRKYLDSMASVAARTSHQMTSTISSLRACSESSRSPAYVCVAIFDLVVETTTGRLKNKFLKSPRGIYGNLVIVASNDSVGNRGRPSSWHWQAASEQKASTREGLNTYGHTSVRSPWPLCHESSSACDREQQWMKGLDRAREVLIL